MEEAVYQIPTDSELHALLSSCSFDMMATPSWPSPCDFPFGDLAYNDPYVRQTSFTMDDMVLDGFVDDINTDDMIWTTSRSEPDTSTTVAQQRRRTKDKKPSSMTGMQSMFSTNPKSYVASQSPKAWESRKTELHRLYIHEDKTLKEIMSVMEPRGFKASAKMYKTRFKQWGFVKNNSREDVAKMIQVRRQRAFIGKPTTFERNGKVVEIDKYLRKNGIIICDLSSPASMHELPRTVRCHTPPPEALPTPGPLLLKELIMRCLKDLSPSFSRLNRPGNGEYCYSTALWDSPRYLKLACNLFSENRHTQAGSICNSAFQSIHTLVDPPRLDTLFNFLVSQLWWENRDITLELWRYLAAYMSNVLRAQNGVYHLLRGLIEYIETYGYNSYLDFMTECIDDILRQTDEDKRPLWFVENQLTSWCQLIVMDCYFLNGYNARADRIQARCAQALPRSRFFPQDRKINEELWRETFSRDLRSSVPLSKSSRHEKFLKLAFTSYARALGGVSGLPAIHPSLTRIEAVARSLADKRLDPAVLAKHQRSYNLESRILSFLTRDPAKGGGMPSEYGSYPV